MDISKGSPEASKFITNVGLITTRNPIGDNIMAAEWTHHIAYSPGLIAISIHKVDATYKNIKDSNEFGVNICAQDQNVISSISGNVSGKEIDKIAALKELGFKFYQGKQIKALMVQDSAMNAECKLITEIPSGDHILLIGEVLHAQANDKEPLAYHLGKYWKLGEQIKKPEQEILNKIAQTLEKHKK
jgi:flavin reductase (DIM6/NTAB) family NADH-FMN oxidoreductase RutF